MVHQASGGESYQRLLFSPSDTGAMPQKIRPSFLHPWKVGKANETRVNRTFRADYHLHDLQKSHQRDWDNLEATLILPEAAVERIATFVLCLDRSLSERRHHFRRHLTFYGTSYTFISKAS